METKYAVDRIEGDIVILEDLESRQLELLSKEILGFNVSDGDIIVYRDGVYTNDKTEKEKRLEYMKAKLARVRRPESK